MNPVRSEAVTPPACQTFPGFNGSNEPWGPMRNLLIAIVCIGLSGCDDLGPEPVVRTRLEVAPYKAWCMGFSEHLCLQGREPGESAFEPLFQTPTGFEFEWGYEYVILIDEIEIANPLADGSSIDRRLDTVESRRMAPAGTSFDLVVRSRWLQPLSDSQLAILGETIGLECLDSDCASLIESASRGPRVHMTLELAGISGAPLQILEWRSCEEPSGPCDP